MRQSNPTYAGLSLSTLAVLLCTGGWIQAQDIVRVNNPTTVMVYYSFSYDNGATWSRTQLPPQNYQDFRPVGLPLTVQFYSGAALQTFALSSRRGRVAQYDFLFVAGGGVDLFGPR